MSVPIKTHVPLRLAFIGSAGVPNRYGGFEAFLEHCGPDFVHLTTSTTVTCDARLYPDRERTYCGMSRLFLRVPANGVWSILHDLVAFLLVFPQATQIVVLGVSGGPWFPLFRLLCDLTGKRLLINIDGVEWRRPKFGRTGRWMLRAFDALAQWSSHTVVYDNAALREFVRPMCRIKAVQIGYSGDHVLRVPGMQRNEGLALTVCRIEPDNSIEMLIEGALKSSLTCYTIVGNWRHSAYGRNLRERYSRELRLSLLDPVYDPDELARLRESCGTYIHGHRVGGTNPSLVEMLFYDCRILCIDVAFHHMTAGDCASYFADAEQLAQRIAEATPTSGDRQELRQRYSSSAIASQYIRAMTGAEFVPSGLADGPRRKPAKR